MRRKVLGPILDKNIRAEKPLAIYPYRRSLTDSPQTTLKPAQGSNFANCSEARCKVSVASGILRVLNGARVCSWRTSVIQAA